MANNTTKTYSIEILMDDARNQLADAIKKLETLDQSLEGIDQNSAAGKKIVADMAAAVKQVEVLTAEVGGLGEQLDNLKPGTVGALEQEIEELEKAFRASVIGTKEQEAALLALGKKKGELKSLEDALDALAPKERAAAFVDMANGLAGVVGVATAAGQALGLSADTAAQYEAKMQTVVAVTSSFEAISKALNSESRANVSNLLSTAKAYLTGGEAATTGGKAARLAIASTGIGLLIVALAYVVTNWEKLTKTVAGSESGFARVKATASGLFDGLLASVKAGAEALTKFVSGDFSGAATVMRGAGKKIGAAYNAGFQESLFDGYKVQLQKQIDFNEEVLKVQQASGRNTYDLQRKLILDRIVVAKQGTEEEKRARLALIGDLAALDRTEEKRRKDVALAATQARLDAVATLEATKGNDAFRKELRAKQQQLATLQAAAQPDAAAIIAKQAEISALTIQHEQQLAEKRRAALVQAQQNEVALLEAQGKITLDLRIKFAEQQLALDTGTNAKALAQKQADQQALRLLLVEQANFEKDLAQKRFEAAQDEQADITDARNAFNEGAQQGATDAIQRATDEAKRVPSLGQTILEKLFGVSKEKSEALKGQLSEAFAGLRDVAVGFANDLLSESIGGLEAQIQATQDRLSEVGQQLDQSRSAAQQTEGQLAESTGAKRDFLLQKLTKERAETERLAAAKAKAAADEKRQQAEKEKLEKRQQQLIAATTLVTNISTAASAVDAGVKAVAGASALPFPASIPAIFAALAAVVGAVASAKSLSKTFADGGTVYGPSHAAGGIQMWHRSGAHLGEFEGGEHITPADATARNAGALELIRTTGRGRTLTPADFAASFPRLSYEVLPPPVGYYPGSYANGGTLPTGGLASAPGASGAPAPSSGLLEAQVGRTNELLEQVVGHTALSAGSTKRVADFGPPVLAFGYEAEAARRRISAELDIAENSAAL